MRKGIASILSIIACLCATPIILSTQSCAKQTQDVENQTKRRLTWKTDEGVLSIAVDGYDQPPVEAEIDTQLRFKVNLKPGCSIVSVKINKKVATADDSGFYNITVTKNMTTIIKTIETLEDLVIESNPTKLLYYDGEQLDLTGLVVKAKYASRDDVEVKQATYLEDGYIVSYPSKNQDKFKLGDDKFTISYAGVTKEIRLEDSVYYKAEINADGATMSNEYISYIQGIKDSSGQGLYKLKINDDRSLITFSFDNDVIDDSGNTTYTGKHKLASNVLAPTKEQLTKDGYDYISCDAATIPANSTSSVTMKVKWEFLPIKVSKLEVKMDNNKPCLIVTGKYNTPLKTRLELVEKLTSGAINGKVIGDTYQGNTGDDLIVKFDLSKLPTATRSAGGSFATKWLSIRFVSGTNLDDSSTCKYVDLAADGSIEFDVNASLRYDKYTYLFTTFNYNGVKTIQVYYVINNFTFTTSLEEVDNVYNLVIDGTVAKDEYKGKVFAIDYVQSYNQSNTSGTSLASFTSNKYKFNIDSTTGKFKATLPISQFGRNTSSLFRTYVYDDMTSTTNRLGSGTHYLLPAESDTAFESLTDKTVGIKSGYYLTNAIHYKDSKSTAYYFGYYLGDRLCMYARDENKNSYSWKDTNLDIREEGENVYFIIKGTYTGDINRIAVQFDFEHSATWENANNTPQPSAIAKRFYPDQYAVSTGSGKFEIKIDAKINAVANRKSMLIPHYGIGRRYDITGWTASQLSTSTVTKDGFTYSLSIGQVLGANNWGKDVPGLKIVPAE